MMGGVEFRMRNSGPSCWMVRELRMRVVSVRMLTVLESIALSNALTSPPSSA